MEYSQIEKLEIVLDIVKKLKNYTGKNGSIVNLYNDSYSFVPIFKKICNDYIKGDTEYNGNLEFVEIDKTIKYCLPIKKNKKATFIIKMK
jgi:hypothetical protein